MENALHRVLDVAFAEDDCRLRQGHGAENFPRLRRIALNLRKARTTRKRGMQTRRLGIKNKRLPAGLDHDYLPELPSG